MTTDLVVLTEIEKRLATIQTVDGAKDIRDKAEALRVYAKSAKKGLDVQNQAAFVKIQAERRGGQIIEARNPGAGRPKNNSDRLSEFHGMLKAAELDQRTAHRWQTMALVSEASLRKLFAAAMDAQEELTSAAIYRLARSGEAAVHEKTEALRLKAVTKRVAENLDDLEEMRSLNTRVELVELHRKVDGVLRRSALDV